MSERSARRREKRAPLSAPLVPLWVSVVVAAIGGYLLDCAFPSLGIWPLAFVAIAAALVTLIGRSIPSALLVGLVFGAAFYFPHVIWAKRYLGDIPWIALAGLEAVFWGVGSILIVLAYRWVPLLSPRPSVTHTATAVVVGGVWTARELFMGSWPYTGFPWGRIGMSQSESPVSALSSWVGVTGVTFIMVTAVALLVEIARFMNSDAARLPRPPLQLALPAAAVVVGMFAIPAFPTQHAGSMIVGSVQGNGPAGYFDSRQDTSVLQAQLTATSPILGQKIDVLLWPEGGVDWDPQAEPGVARVLDSLSSRIDAPILMNAVTKRGDQYFNTSMLWQAGKGATATFDKRFPVPFGEYVPDRWFYNAIVPDLIGLIQREYSKGTNSPVVRVGATPVGLAICFDVIYDSVVWQGASEGAQVYMFQTNNADFRGTDENLQQLAMARMRAIETGRSVVNVSTVGTSQVITPTGATVSELDAGKAGAMVDKVELRTGLTPAVILGGAIQQLLLWGSLAALVVIRVVVAVRNSKGRRP